MAGTYIDEIDAIVRRAETEAYERGKADAKREMLALLTTNASLQPEAGKQTLESRPPRSAGPAQVRGAGPRKQRAPRGAVRGLIYRTLASQPGLKTAEILACADTEAERMIQPTSLGNELRRGREASRYHCTRGRWYLAKADKIEAEGNPSQDQPSASNSSQGGSHAPALAE